MPRLRETKTTERLLTLTKEKQKLLREEIHAGVDYQAEYDSEKNEEQKYTERLKELRAHNARVESEAVALGFKNNGEREAKENADAEAKAKADAEAKEKADAEAKAPAK